MYFFVVVDIVVKRIRFKKADKRKGEITRKNLYLNWLFIVFLSLVYEKCLTEVNLRWNKKVLTCTHGLKGMF